MDRDTYLEISSSSDDAGEKVGRTPASLSTEELLALPGPQSPIRAIRAKCVDCSGGSQSEARKCVMVDCALWPFRMGRNVFHGRR